MPTLEGDHAMSFYCFRIKAIENLFYEVIREMKLREILSRNIFFCEIQALISSFLKKFIAAISCSRIVAL